MKLEINNEPTHKNIFEIKIYCSYNSNHPILKVEQHLTLYISPENIEKTILEIETVKNQLGTNREYDNEIYNQRNFFLLNEEDFTWLKKVKTYQKTNYTLQSYEVSFYNSSGIKSSVEVKDLESYLDAFKELNERHKIANYFWSEEAEDSDYDNYFREVKFLMTPYLLSHKLNKELDNKTKMGIKRKI